MKSATRFLVFSSLLSLGPLLTSPFAQAQNAARAAAPAIPSPRTFSTGGSAHAVPARGANTMPRNSAVHKSHISPTVVKANSWSPRVFGSFLTPAPGPGFEFGYLNGANPGFGPVRRRHNGAGRNSRGFGSGFYLLGGEGYYAAPADDAAVPVAEDQQVSDQILGGAQDQSQPREELATKEPAAEFEQAAPVRDEGEFTLVLRDGSRISALAFTHSSDKIIYISPDGGRRTLANADLDADATVRVNQERGTPLQLPL